MLNHLAGGQEQSRLVGLEAARAAFENNAQNQNYAQLADRRFANGSALGFPAGAGRAMYGACPRRRGYGQQMGMACSTMPASRRTQPAAWALRSSASRTTGPGSPPTRRSTRNYSAGRTSPTMRRRSAGAKPANIDASNAALQQMTNDNYAALTHYLKPDQRAAGQLRQRAEGLHDQLQHVDVDGAGAERGRAACWETVRGAQPAAERINSLLGNTGCRTRISSTRRCRRCRPSTSPG